MYKILLVFLLLSAVVAEAGQLYRWVDETGRVSYSDQPPPASTKKVTTISGKGNVVEVDKESYAARQAKKLNPVVLYATDCGQLCGQSIDFLKQRHVPYSTRDPSKDLEIALELKKLTGATDVPVLAVGGSFQKGFDAAAWNRMLDAANYPK